jgi:hypothetical protein
MCSTFWPLAPLEGPGPPNGGPASDGGCSEVDPQPMNITCLHVINVLW